MSPLSVLGLEESKLDTDPEKRKDEIKRAYKKMALKYHPDRPNGDTEKFKDISTAYETLMNSNGTTWSSTTADDFGFEDPYELFKEVFGASMDSFETRYGGETFRVVRGTGIFEGIFDGGDIINNLFSNFNDILADEEKVDDIAHAFISDETSASKIAKTINNVYDDEPVKGKKENKKNQATSRKFKTKETEVDSSCIDVKIELNVKASDVYNCRKVKIPVERIRIDNGKSVLETKKLAIPLRHRLVSYSREGHQINSDSYGDAVFQIKIKNKDKDRTRFYWLENDDLLIQQEVPILAEEFLVPLLNKKIRLDCHKKNPAKIIKVNGSGFVKSESDSASKERSDAYIQIIYVNADANANVNANADANADANVNANVNADANAKKTKEDISDNKESAEATYIDNEDYVDISAIIR